MWACAPALPWDRAYSAKESTYMHRHDRPQSTASICDACILMVMKRSQRMDCPLCRLHIKVDPRPPLHILDAYMHGCMHACARTVHVHVHVHVNALFINHVQGHQTSA
eukprot:159820-Chlamydomonas_euryale.AAC.8